MMQYALINQKMVEFFVKTSYVYQAKGANSLCHLFIFTFNRSRTHAEYYTIIKQPIDLIRIQQKIRTDEYQTLEQFTDDIQLLLNNAKTFYKVKEKIRRKNLFIWFFSARKTPMNGVMPMICSNILIQKSTMKIPIENDHPKR